MPPITDIAAIRRILAADPAWCVYALGDLLPHAQPKSLWFTPDLSLVYRDFGACILFAMGTASIPEALAHVDWPVYLQLQPDALAAVERHAVIAKRHPMWRMIWTGDRSGWVDTSSARRLTPADVPALQRLYEDGASTGESPDFFFPDMVPAGVFFGTFEGGELTAAAGTHLYAPSEGAAAIGNVYTRRDRRGRGLSRIVTCATLGALADLPHVGLNVRRENAPAIKVYESLGFRKHCQFFEAVASAPR